MNHTLLAAAVALTIAVPAFANERITNGGFETGDFTSWGNYTLATSSGFGAIVGNGAPSHIFGFPTQTNANGGNWVYLTDQSGPGTYDLIQGFSIPVGTVSVTVSFDQFVNDFSGAGPIVDPIGLDHTGPANQHARVDILTASASPFTTAASDIVATLYIGTDGGQIPNPWISYSFDLTPLLLPGQFYAIRFAQTDNLGNFNQGVDNVSVWAVAVPEPATWAMLIAGFGLVGSALRRQRVLAA